MLSKQEVSPEQRQNLTKLADFLESGSPLIHFNMRTFHADLDPDLAWGIGYERQKPTSAPHCNSVGCAIGHGPLAGIKLVASDESWWTYCYRVFGITTGPTFDWLFEGDWADRDNTPTGAAKRIRHFLEHGVPENATEQLYGDEPYIFA